MKTLEVLLIEKEKREAQAFKKMLNARSEETPSFTLTHVKSLEEGLPLLSEKKIDVVVLDIALSNNLGLQPLTEVREQNPDLPIVILTSFENSQLGLDLLRKGAQDYLIKGEINSKRLSRVLHYAIERKRLEMLKDEYLSIVSHELRTPLAIIKSAVTHLRDGLGDRFSDQEIKYLEMSQRNIDRLVRIVNEILELSRLESRRATIHRRNVLLVPIAHEAVQGVKMASKSKEIDITEKYPDDLVPVYADQELLTQVFQNLLNNALRFARSNIAVEIKIAGEKAEVVVADDGMGIDADKLEDIFVKFIQADRPAGGVGYKGTGLGLAICREIIDLHGGKIWVDSDKGRGAKFHFAIPQAKGEGESSF